MHKLRAAATAHAQHVKHYDPAVQAHMHIAAAGVLQHWLLPMLQGRMHSSCLHAVASYRMKHSKGRARCFASEVLCCAAALIAAGGCKTPFRFRV